MSMWHVQYWRDKFLGCLGITLVVFGLPYLMQDTPLELYGGWDNNEQRQQQLVAFYGLDRSLLEQYGIWLYRMVSGQWGDSRFYNRSVWSDSQRAMGQTSILIGWTLMVVMGWIWLWPRLCQWWRPPRTRWYPTSLFFILILPNFIVVILVRDLLLWRVGWLSMAHMPAFAPFYLFNPFYMIVPAILLALVPCAVWTSVSPLPLSRQPVQFGKSMGRFCRRFRPLLAGLLFELFLLEQILSVPGLGRMGIAALKRRDVPMLQGFILCTIILYFVLSILLDWGAKRYRLPYAWLAVGRPAASDRIAFRWPILHQRYRGILGLLLLLAIAIWTPQLSPYDPSEIHSDDQLLRISYRYFLGTDFLGRDVLSRTLSGCRAEVPRSWLIMSLSGSLGGLIVYLGRYLPRWLRPIMRLCLVVYHTAPPFLMVFLIFLIADPSPWSLEIALLLGLMPSTLYLLSRPRPLTERLLSLARIGGEALLFLVIFHFLNLVPDVANPTWGSELRMGMTYSQNNAWLLVGPALVLLWAYYSFYMTGLARVGPKRTTEAL
jgi:ABC-type dipeptide/oligopeptide/nickel transport system permease component/ABC-type dipeptide/oligopeptide/nickel transport system permease subunit